jgi:hypothetical protein
MEEKIYEGHVFPWDETIQTEPPICFKWKVANRSYEVYHPTLSVMTFQRMIPHILSLKNAVKQVVGHRQDQGSSLFQVFPRTISSTMAATWLTEVALLTEQYNEEDVFDDCARAFIAVVAETKDQTARLQQIQTINTLPRNMDAAFKSSSCNWW